MSNLTFNLCVLAKTQIVSTLTAKHANPANRELVVASGLATLAALALARSRTQNPRLPRPSVARTTVPRSWSYPSDGSVVVLRWQPILAPTSHLMGAQSDAHEMHSSAFACQRALVRSQLCGGRAGVQGESVR